MEILSKFRAVQSLVFVYMLVVVIDVSGMLPMRTIFCLTCNRNISQKKRREIIPYSGDIVGLK